MTISGANALANASFSGVVSQLDANSINTTTLTTTSLQVGGTAVVPVTGGTFTPVLSINGATDTEQTFLYATYVNILSTIIALNIYYSTSHNTGGGFVTLYFSSLPHTLRALTTSNLPASFVNSAVTLQTPNSYFVGIASPGPPSIIEYHQYNTGDSTVSFSFNGATLSVSGCYLI